MRKGRYIFVIILILIQLQSSYCSRPPAGIFLFLPAYSLRETGNDRGHGNKDNYLFQRNLRGTNIQIGSLTRKLENVESLPKRSKYYDRKYLSRLIMGSYNIFSVESFEPEETSEEIIVTPPEIDENTNTNMQNIFSVYREEITDANRCDGFLEDLIASKFSYGTKENNIEEDIFKMTDKNSSTNTSTSAIDPNNSAGNRTAGCLLPLEIKILLQLKLEEHFQPRPEESTSRASYKDSFAEYLISALRNTTNVEFIGISESSSLFSPKAPHNDISQSVGVETKEVQQNIVAVYDTGKPLSVTQVIPMTCDDFIIDSDTCYLVKASINVYTSPDADKKVVKDAVITALSHELTIF